MLKVECAIAQDIIMILYLHVSSRSCMLVLMKRMCAFGCHLERASAVCECGVLC